MNSSDSTVGNYQEQNLGVNPQRCPNCGACPHCGQSPYQFHQPYWYQPLYQPSQPFYPTWGSTSVVCSTPNQTVTVM